MATYRNRLRTATLAAVGLLLCSACSGDNTSQSIDVSAITSTAVITSTTIRTATTEPATVGPHDYDFSAVSPIVQEFVTQRGLNGAGLIVVDRDDGVVFEHYWGEFDADRISLIASSSKMIVAGVLLRLQDDGLLDINAPVADAVEWGQGNPTIKPAQLLSNSSGLVGLLSDPTYPPYACQWNASGSLQECAEAIFTTPDDDADVVGPDSRFRYGGAQWQVAGGVAEAVSGKPWAQLVTEIYTEPCGLKTLAFNNHLTQFGSFGFVYPVEFKGDPSTLTATMNPNMEGGAYATTGDYAKLLLMHLRGGMCGDRRVLSQEALDQMHTDRIGDAFDGYGMGWWIDQASGRISDPGAYGAVPWLDLGHGFGAYLVLEADSGAGNDLAGMLYGPVKDAVTGRRAR